MENNTEIVVYDYAPDQNYFYYQGRLMRSRVLGAVLAGGEIAIICGIAIMFLGALVQFKTEQAATAAAIVAAQTTPTPVATAIPADTNTPMGIVARAIDLVSGGSTMLISFLSVLIGLNIGIGLIRFMAKAIEDSF